MTATLPSGFLRRLLRQGVAAVIAALWLLLIAAPATAATDIAYSVPENIYGWCAGYSAEYAPQCAQQYCGQSGGTDCKVILECSAGWNSVAFADDLASGFGAACGLRARQSARVGALIKCIVASNTVCWTSSTFNDNGSERSETENKDFDIAWYSQVVLLSLGYDVGDVDGEIGPKTRAAIKAFQEKYGFAADGKADENFVYLLIHLSGGMTSFVDKVKSGLEDKQTADDASTLYGVAGAPAPQLTLTQDLLKRSDALRSQVVTAIVRDQGAACTMPAKVETDPPDGSWDFWRVYCDEGEQSLLMANGIIVLTAGHSVLDDQTTSPTETPADTPADSTVVADDPTTPVTDTTPGTDTATPASGSIAYAHAPSTDTTTACTGEPAEAGACAVKNCTTAGGPDCQVAVTCIANGWSAVAVSADTLRGVGIACGMGNSYGARYIALEACISATNSICSVASTTSPEGVDESADSNTSFDFYFSAQIMLAITGDYTIAPDGLDSEATQEAAKAFQTKVGLEPTGVIDIDLYTLLTYAVRGDENLVAVGKQMLAGLDASFTPLYYAKSTLPAETIPFSQELAAVAPADRLRYLAAAISLVQGAKCTMPALSAEPVPDATSGVWRVGCAEGSVDVTFTGTDMTVGSADQTAAAPVDPVTTPPATDTGLVIAYASVNDARGICMGSSAESQSCALDECAKVASTTCVVVLTCPTAGWTATAVSRNELLGSGFACGFANPASARTTALVACIKATNSICTINQTVDSSGTPLPVEDNALFDLTYKAQAMLALTSYYTVGVTGESTPETQAAVVAFQKDLGLDPTAILDQDLYTLLYYAQRGEGHFVTAMNRDVYDTMDPSLASLHYEHSDLPLVTKSYSDELAALAEPERLRALAVTTTLSPDYNCTIPALTAVRTADPNTWDVDCSEGMLRVVFDNDSFTVTAREATPTETKSAPQKALPPKAPKKK